MVIKEGHRFLKDERTALRKGIHHMKKNIENYSLSL